jgi:flagellar motor switch protein FliG
MGTGKSIVITAYGHDKTIDKIAVSSFDCSNNYGNDSGAGTYCKTINSLELNGNSWIFAKVVSENTQYSLGSFLPLKIDVILKLDDRVIQGLLRDVNSQDIAVALRGEKENVREKIFRNMSGRAAQMLKEDMEYMGSIPIPVNEVKKIQEKIIDRIRHLEEFEEMIIHSIGETLE